MCYHVSLNVPAESILQVFPDLKFDPRLPLDFLPTAYVNGFDHKMQPVMLTSRKDGTRHLASMMWGYLPSWVKNMDEATRLWNGYKDDNGKFRPGLITLNAVGEEVLEKPMYKDAALHRRCIVFADGFYEWHHHYPIGKNGQPLKTAVKYPHFIKLKENPHPFIMMAGIWNPWKHQVVSMETGELTEAVEPTFAILTTAANALMEKIHNSKKRMPVILDQSQAERWISEGLTTDEIQSLATTQFPANRMEAYSIARDFQQLADPKERFHYEEWTGIC